MNLFPSCMHGAHRGEMRVLDPLDLELLIAILGIKIRSSEESQCSKHWAMSSTLCGYSFMSLCNWQINRDQKRWLTSQTQNTVVRNKGNMCLRQMYLEANKRFQNWLWSWLLNLLCPLDDMGNFKRMNSWRVWDLSHWTVPLRTVRNQIVESKHKNGRQDDWDHDRIGISSLEKSRKSRFCRNYVESEGSNINKDLFHKKTKIIGFETINLAMFLSMNGFKMKFIAQNHYNFVLKYYA